MLPEQLYLTSAMRGNAHSVELYWRESEIEIERTMQTDRQTDRQTADRQTYRQTRAALYTDGSEIQSPGGRGDRERQRNRG